MKEKLYRVVCRTDAYKASRNSRFKEHETECIVRESLSLKQAYMELLYLYNVVCTTLPGASNWGCAVRQSKRCYEGAQKTFKDGTRSFCYDGYTYSIEQEG